MAFGIPIAVGQLTTSTSDSANLIEETYRYVGPGKIRIYAKGSDANVRVTFFLNGQKVVLARSPPSYGTAGTLSTSDNLVAEFTTLLGGIAEFTIKATTGTPTADYLVTHEGIPILSPLARALRGR